MLLKQQKGKIMKEIRLSDTKLFQGISEREIHLMLDCLQTEEKYYKKDEMILHMGDMVSSLGMVISGSVGFWVSPPPLPPLPLSVHPAAKRTEQTTASATHKLKNRIFFMLFTPYTNLFYIYPRAFGPPRNCLHPPPFWRAAIYARRALCGVS